jgi:hypothetical protein
MGHLLGYARVSTTDHRPATSNPSSRSTPSGAPAATGCSPRPPAAPAPTARSSPRFWTSSALATPSWYGSWTALAAPSPSRRHRHRPGRPRHRVPQPPGSNRHHHSGRQAGVLRLCRPSRVRTRPSPRTHSSWVGCCSGPRPPRRPTTGADRAQASVGAGGVSLWGVHRGHDRHDVSPAPPALVRGS